MAQGRGPGVGNPRGPTWGMLVTYPGESIWPGGVGKARGPGWGEPMTLPWGKLMARDKVGNIVALDIDGTVDMLSDALKCFE